MNTYNVLWLDQAMPGFSTPDGALAPFLIRHDTPWTSLGSITWTAQTSFYSSALDCQPAKTLGQGNQSNCLMYDTGKDCVTYGNRDGCVVDDTDISGLIPDRSSVFSSCVKAPCQSENETKPFLAFSFSNSNPKSYLTTAGKGKGLRHSTLSKGGFEKGSVASRWASFWSKTVLFCEPRYYVQSVNATVTTPNMTVSKIVPLTSPEQLSPDLFDVRLFESLVAGRWPYNVSNPSADKMVTSEMDINETTQMFDTSQIDALGVSDVIESMIVFAVGTSKLTANDYLNSTALAASLDKAYKILFALGICSVFSDGITQQNERLGIIKHVANGITMVKPLARLFQILLGLVALLIAILTWLLWGRQLELYNDPMSLSHLLKLIGNECETLRAVRRLHVNSDDRNYAPESLNKTIAMPKSPLRSKRLLLPRVMGFAIGTVFVIILTIALITLLTLWTCIQKRHGLKLPSESSVVTQLALNYVPVAFATFLEPFWTLLNAKLCLMKPFAQLQSEEVVASQTMNLRYTSLPPQMILWRALKARHFLLGAVCVTALSTNILAVALSALFNTKDAAIVWPISFNNSFLPSFSQPINETDYRSLYLAAANFSHGTPLPGWVTSHWYFVPFKSNEKFPLETIHSTKAITPGFKLIVSCTEYDVGNPSYVSLPGRDNEIAHPQMRTNESNTACMREWNTFYDSLQTSDAAIELLAPLTPNSEITSQNEYEVCGSRLGAAFLRAQLHAEVEGVDSLVTSSEWMVCNSTLVTAMFEVEVDPTGGVLNYLRRSDDSADLTFATNETLPSLLNNIFHVFLEPFNKRPLWRNGTYEDSWFGFLIKAFNDSAALVDPSLPAPGYHEIAPVTEDVIMRLFPIMLSLQPPSSLSAPWGNFIEGSCIVYQERVFMSQSMFILTVLLLILNIAVAAAYCIYRPSPIPSGVPDTIGSTLALFERSGLPKEQMLIDPWPQSWRFSYGYLLDDEGKKQGLGIDRLPFVVPFKDGRRKELES
ncbi:MAG: hypothetical protein Q9190_002862 [Brigantiaea leucoxantha]